MVNPVTRLSCNKGIIGKSAGDSALVLWIAGIQHFALETACDGLEYIDNYKYLEVSWLNKEALCISVFPCLEIEENKTGNANTYRNVKLTWVNQLIAGAEKLIACSLHFTFNCIMPYFLSFGMGWS
eukprot:1139974-Pelagomonas_calceolata.AAC.3